MTLCEDTNGELAGFQVFIGIFYNTAGAAHGGDFTGSCKNYELEGRVVEIDFFTRNQDDRLVGMRVETQPYDSKGKTNVFSAGVVQESRVGSGGDYEDLKIWRNYFRNTSGRDFWGFKSEVDSSGFFTKIEIISYDEEDLNACMLDGQGSGKSAALSEYWTYSVGGDYEQGYHYWYSYIQLEQVMQRRSASASYDWPEDIVEQVENGAIAWHIEEDEEANTGAIIACIIGAIVLVGLLGYCLWRMCRAKDGREAANVRGGRGGTILVNQSAMSSGTNQGKLDDIM